MIRTVYIEGVKATVQKFNFKVFSIDSLMIVTLILSGCNNTTTSNIDDPGRRIRNETAATVNGKAIKLEEVERGLKQQAQGQESRMSPLELAAARLQILESLIQQEVMYQKAEKEETVPTDEEVTAEFNKLKTGSGQSAEQFEKKLQETGETEATLKDSLKKQLAFNKLIDKITGKIESPKDSEIEAFYNSNKEGFKNKRGAQLAAIVIDPEKTSDSDTTTTDIEAQQKAKEVGERCMRGADFATVAREASEDPQTKMQGGDWRYFTEEEMKQAFGQGLSDYVMTKMKNGDVIPQAIPFQGKILILKLQSKQETDEDRTLETPGVREEITKYFIDSRKQLLSQSYAAVTLNEAKIENFLAQKVVENPNELSGARPANAEPANTNPITNVNANSAVSNANSQCKTRRNTNATANANTANKANTGK